MLTARERDVYRVLLQYWRDRRQPPSAAQIGRRSSPKPICPTRVNVVLRDLVRKGVVEIPEPTEPEEQNRPRARPAVGTEIEQIDAELQRLEELPCS